MKLTGIFLSIVLFVGLIILYLLGIAFRVDILTFEMLGHITLRFFSGFVILGIFVFYEHLFRLKHSLWFLLLLFLADDIYDYYRQIKVDSFKPEMLIISIFMLLWGALTGYLTMKTFNARKLN